jgi:hypothetical protein
VEWVWYYQHFGTLKRRMGIKFGKIFNLCWGSLFFS